MRGSLLVLFLFVCSGIFRQNKKLDSLWKVYNTKAQADTNRLKAIHNIAWSYVDANPDTAIILAEKELDLAYYFPG